MNGLRYLAQLRHPWKYYQVQQLEKLNRTFWKYGKVLLIVVELSPGYITWELLVPKRRRPATED